MAKVVKGLKLIISAHFLPHILQDIYIIVSDSIFFAKNSTEPTNYTWQSQDWRMEEGKTEETLYY